MQTEATTSYHKGRVVTAVKILESAIGSAAPSDKLYWPTVFLLLDICESSYDLDCFRRHINKLSAAPIGEVTKREDANRVFYYMAAYAWLSGDRSIVEQVKKGALTRSPSPHSDPVLYIRCQLLAAKLLIVEGDLSEGRQAVDRALALILSDKSPPPFYLASWLNDSIMLLAQAGDVTRAVSLYFTSNAFISKYLPEGGLDYARFRLVEASLFEYFGNPALTIEKIRAGESLLTNLELTERVSVFFRASVLTSLIANCAIIEDTKCASDAISRHPYNASAALISDKGIFVSPLALNFVAASTFSYVLVNKPIPKGWIAAMDNPTTARNDWTTKDENGYRLFARGLARIGVDRAGATEDLIEAGRSRAYLYDRLHHASEDVFPLLTNVGRLVVNVALKALAEKGNLNSDEKDLAVSLVAIQNRSLRRVETDDLASLASVSSQDLRRMLHSRMRLYARQQASERTQLIALMSSIESGASNAFASDWYDFFVHRRFSTYGITRARLSQGIQKRSGELKQRPFAPSHLTLQAALKPDEAFIAVALEGGNLTHMCVRSGSFSLKSSTPDLRSTQVQIETLQRSFTRQYAPIEGLDARYPAEEAQALYQTLLKPVEDCLDGVNHIIWAPEPILLALPVAALLRTLPPGTDGSYDLSKAEWVGQRFGISYVTGAREFIAARQLARNRSADFGFLGIGDPVLSGMTADGKPRSDVVLRNAASGTYRAVKELNELPETSQELKSILEVAASESKILTREKATERQFRREPLDRYSVMSFATHGLVKSDVPGLTEAALVLTPENELDPSDDGLLTATEIAGLNLNANLVILSACNSANFDVSNFAGEVQGLSTAFTVAGASAVLATLWPVETNTARDLMVSTFKNLQGTRGVAPAIAFRNALNEFLKKPPNAAFRNPRFWAPFVIYGDGGTVSVPAPAVNDQLRLTHLSIPESVSTGETGAITRDLRGDGAYIQGFGEKKGERFQSFVSHMSASGSVDWTYWDPKVGSSFGVAEDGKGVTVGGYLTTSDKRSVPVVFRLTKTGRFVWQKEISIGAREGIPAFVKPDSNGNAIVLIDVKEGAEVGKTRNSLLVTVLNPLGEELSRREILIEVGYDQVTARAYSVFGKIMVVAKLSGMTATDKKITDDYGLNMPCIVSKRLQLILLDPKTLEPSAPVFFNNLEIADVIENAEDGRVIAAATSYSCGQSSRAALVGIDRALKLTPLYEFQDVFTAESVAVVAKPGGNRVDLIVRSTRIVDVEQGKKVDYSKPQPFDEDAINRNLGQRDLSDLLILELDGQGKFISESWIQAGAGIYATGALWLKDKLHLVGSVGWHQMHAMLH